MSISYEDALDLAIESLRRGDNLESVLSRWPEHAPALREDLTTHASLQRYGAAMPQASDSARTAASTRLMSQLQAGRTARIEAQQQPVPWYRRFGLPRLIAATAVVILALIAVSFFSLNGKGGTTAEAATLEGVVVDNVNGSLTIQTLDTLEQVTVPANTPVSTADGAPLALNGIQVGQVVTVNGLRRKGVVQAARIQRIADDVSSWCNDDSARCQTLANSLSQAEQACTAHPAACATQVQRVTELRNRVAGLAVLSDLKTRCKNGESTACAAIVTYCQAHLDVCGGQVPQVPAQDNGNSTNLRDRLKTLQDACNGRDTAACRRVEQLCTNNPGLCKDITPSPATGSSGPTAPSTSTGSAPPRG